MWSEGQTFGTTELESEVLYFNRSKIFFFVENIDKSDTERKVKQKALKKMSTLKAVLP